MTIGRTTRTIQRRRRPHISIPENDVSDSRKQDVETRLPAKKALLIGIGYGKELKGPHKDVHDMRDLLIEKFGYTPADIILMADCKDVEQTLQPTRQNILEQISTLVENAKSGDRFFFHYSGHAMQIENRNNSEDDGMDEYLIPCEGESEAIPDNELRRRLVDRLPIGSHLVAVFDSCHSATLLDLEHYHCNRVFVPWISKGRRKSNTRWNANVRKNGMDVKTIRVFASERTSNDVVSTKKTTLETLSPNLPATLTDDQVRTRVFRRTSKPIRMRSTFASSSPSATLVGSEANDTLRSSYATTVVGSAGSSWFGSALAQCESPTSFFPCDGNCRDCPEFAGACRRCSGPQEEKPLPVQKAEVISISSCEDHQSMWEDGSGRGMTQVLIQILRESLEEDSQGLTFRELMTAISHNMHKMTHSLHGQTKKYKRDVKAYYKIHPPPIQPQASFNSSKISKRNTLRKLPPKSKSAGEAEKRLEMDNFVDPQLSSHTPLDLNKRVVF